MCSLPAASRQAVTNALLLHALAAKTRQNNCHKQCTPAHMKVLGTHDITHTQAKRWHAEDNLAQSYKAGHKMHLDDSRKPRVFSMQTTHPTKNVATLMKYQWQQSML